MAIPPQFLANIKKKDSKGKPDLIPSGPMKGKDPATLKKQMHHKAKNAAVAKLAVGKQKGK